MLQVPKSIAAEARSWIKVLKDPVGASLMVVVVLSSALLVHAVGQHVAKSRHSVMTLEKSAPLVRTK